MFKIIFGIVFVAVLFMLFKWLTAPRAEGGSRAGKFFSGIFWIIGLVAPYVAIGFHSAELWGQTIAIQIATVTGHFVIGLCYLIYRWSKFDKEKVAAYMEQETEIAQQYRSRPSKEQHLNYSEWLFHKGYKPALSNHINRLAGWGMFWPWYMLVAVLTFLWNVLSGAGKFIHGLYKGIVRRVGKILQKNQDKNWKDIDKK